MAKGFEHHDYQDEVDVFRSFEVIKSWADSGMENSSGSPKDWDNVRKALESIETNARTIRKHLNRIVKG